MKTCQHDEWKRITEHRQVCGFVRFEITCQRCGTTETIEVYQPVKFRPRPRAWHQKELP
jgi:hypothetical protein